LNAANEVAVASFLDRRIGFLDIAAIARETMDGFVPPAPRTLEDVLEVDREARAQAEQAVGRFSSR